MLEGEGIRAATIEFGEEPERDCFSAKNCSLVVEIAEEVNGSLPGARSYTWLP